MSAPIHVHRGITGYVNVIQDVMLVRTKFAIIVPINAKQRGIGIIVIVMLPNVSIKYIIAFIIVLRSINVVMVKNYLLRIRAYYKNVQMRKFKSNWPSSPTTINSLSTMEIQGVTVLKLDQDML